MTVDDQKRAHVFAVKWLRGLGRRLVDGRYGGEPMTGQEAVTIMVRASAIVMRLGVNNVIAAAEDALGRMVGSLLRSEE